MQNEKREKYTITEIEMDSNYWKISNELLNEISLPSKYDDLEW